MKKPNLTLENKPQRLHCINSINKLILTFIFTLIPITIIAQQPTIPCTMCGGSGLYNIVGIPYLCVKCQGKGFIIDPVYALQRAGQNGKAQGELEVGIIHLITGHQCNNKNLISQSFRTFANIYNTKDTHDIGATAAYWLGVCYELGFGVKVDQKQSLAFYQYAKEHNFAAGTESYYRILNEGFLEATETQWQIFIQELDFRRKQNAAAAKAWLDSRKENSNYNLPSNNSTYDSDYFTCPNCHGSGKCSFCAGRGEKAYNGIYYDCEICHGTGKCQSCYGRGKQR